MKSTIISMISVLCVLAVIPMILLDDGSVLARFGLDAPGGSDVHSKAPKNLTHVTTDEKVQVYKWRDQYGVMQFTNTPPPEARQAEVVELTPDANIVKPVQVPEEVPEQSRSRPAVMMTGNPYTPDGMKDLLDTTSSLADGVTQKQLEQQQLMDRVMGTKK